MVTPGTDVVVFVPRELVLRSDESLRTASILVLSPSAETPPEPVAKPTYLSSTPANTDISAAVLGATTIGLALLPQGEHVARVCEATHEDGTPLYPTVVVQMPRRSTKTTSIWNVLVGRCLTTPGYKVVTTAQDGTRARQRFHEVARALTAAGFEESGLGTIRIANGSESITFSNGSRLWVVAPSAAAFRGEAADCLLFDEAGELDVDKSDDLVAGALPLMDTRPMGQVIIAGTPGRERVGLLWDTLEEGRRGDEGVGIVDYSLRDDEQIVTPTGELIEEVLLRIHPGIGTLTTMAKMRARFKKLGLPAFEAEYACRWPFDSTVRAVTLSKWEASASPYTERPERVAFGYAVAKDAATSTVVAAWRDADGIACLEVVRHDTGFGWTANTAAKVAVKYRGLIGYDSIGSNQAVSEHLDRMRPKPRLAPRSLKEMIAACSVLVADINKGRVRHFDQPALNAAAEGAVWRETEGGRLFNSKLSAGDVGPLIAAAAALHVYDGLPVKRETVIIAG